jgi:hypothetical protein
LSGAATDLRRADLLLAAWVELNSATGASMTHPTQRKFRSNPQIAAIRTKRTFCHRNQRIQQRNDWER